MEQHIEFDREKLEAALRGGLDLNDCEPGDIEKLLANAEEEILDELDEQDSTLDIAALGGMYKIGDLDFFVVLGNFALLHVIESPFITELKEGEEISFDDCCEALYILYHGKEAVEPIMHIQQKIKDMLSLRPLVAKNPDLMDKLLDRVEKISEARSQFTQDARDFYLHNFNPDELQEVTERMVAVLQDALLASVPDRDQGKSEKKT